MGGGTLTVRKSAGGVVGQAVPCNVKQLGATLLILPAPPPKAVHIATGWYCLPNQGTYSVQTHSLSPQLHGSVNEPLIHHMSDCSNGRRCKVGKWEWGGVEPGWVGAANAYICGDHEEQYQSELPQCRAQDMVSTFLKLPEVPEASQRTCMVSVRDAALL